MLTHLDRIRVWTEHVGRSRLTFLGALTAGHLVVHWYTNLLSLALPFIKEDLALTDVQIGTVITVQMGVGSVLFVISGFLADSFRRQGTVIVSSGLVSFGLSLFVIGVSPSYGWTLVGAGLMGLGTALWHPAAMGSLSLRFPDRRGMALAVHGVGASIGDAIGPVIVGAIIVVLDWKMVLQMHLVPSLVITLLLWRLLGGITVKGAPRTDTKSYLSGIRAIFADTQAVAVLVSNTLIIMSRLSILAFFPIYIKETLGYPASTLGVYLALLHVTGIVSQPVMGVLSDRVGRKWVLMPSFTLMGLLYMAIVFVSPGVPLAIVVGVIGIFFYGILNISQTAIMDVAQDRVQASTMGIMSLFGLPFTLVSPVLSGLLVESYGITSAFWYASMAALLAAITLVPVRFSHLDSSDS